MGKDGAVVMAWPEVLSQHLPSGTEENHKILIHDNWCPIQE